MLYLIVGLNAAFVLYAAGIASGVLPPKAFSGAVSVLHKIVGISLPTPERERAVAVIWIASAIVIADGTLLLMIVLTRSVFRA